MKNIVNKEKKSYQKEDIKKMDLKSVNYDRNYYVILASI